MTIQLRSPLTCPARKNRFAYGLPTRIAAPPLRATRATGRPNGRLVQHEIASQRSFIERTITRLENIEGPTSTRGAATNRTPFQSPISGATRLASNWRTAWTFRLAYESERHSHGDSDESPQRLAGDFASTLLIQSPSRSHRVINPVMALAIPTLVTRY